MKRLLHATFALALAAPAKLFAQRVDSLVAAYTAAECPSCATWNAPVAPTRLFGNTWYVGTRGLAALLVTSPAGHVLLDAGLPESAPLIVANIRALGFRPEDVRVIVNSHAHYDHAGGIEAVRRLSGARVVASPATRRVLERGTIGPDDPQYGVGLPYPAVAGTIREVKSGDTAMVGPIVLTAHYTGGHAPGGTSWQWRSCEGSTCVSIVYADSQTPVSADDFLFTRSTTYPGAIADFERGFATLERLDCDILVTPHPNASRLWQRMAEGTLIDAGACRRYADSARTQLAARIQREGENSSSVTGAGNPVERYLAAVAREDVEAIMAEFDSAAVYEDVTFDFAIRGRAAISRMFEGMFQGLDSVVQVVHRSIAQDANTVVEWTATGTHVGDVMGVPATGRRITVRAVSIIEVRAGRIVRVTDYTDRAGLEAQLRAGRGR